MRGQQHQQLKDDQHLHVIITGKTPTMSSPNDTLRHRAAHRIARRARSFKQDFIEKLNQIRSPSATRSQSPHKYGHHYRHYKNKLVKGQQQLQPQQTFDSKKSQKSAKKEKDINSANQFVKHLSSALRYFQDVVEKDKLEQLSGSVTIILEIVLTGYSQLKAYLINNEQSSHIVSATNQVYQCLAQLIRWSDDILLNNRDKPLDKENVTEIAKNVLESVNSLVQLCIDRYKNREILNKVVVVDDNNQNNVKPNGSSTPLLTTQTLGRLPKKADPTTLKHNLTNTSSHRSSLPEIPLSPREKQILETTNFETPPPVPYRRNLIDRFNHSLSSDNVLNDTFDTIDGSDPPPPKPPKLPIFDQLEQSMSNRYSDDEINPPPLPPKRFPRTNKLLSQQSFDWPQTCQSSNCHSQCDSIDSCLNLSGLNHLSADDLLSMTRSDNTSETRSYRSQLNSYNTTSSSDENRSNNSYINRYEYRSTKQTKTHTYHYSVDSQSSKESLHFSLSSPPFHSHRIDSLIDKMKSFNAGEDTVDGDIPPQLPVKLRPKLSLSNINNILDTKPMRPVSQYDNIDETCDSSHFNHYCGHDTNQRSQTNEYCPHITTSCPHSISCPHFLNTSAAPNCPTVTVIDSNDLENRPPPLPPKKRNMMVYMQMVDSYNGPESVEFYRHSHTYQTIENQWQAVERTFIQQRSITTSFVSASSDDSVFSLESETSSTPPPLLPPKKKKSMLTTTTMTTPKLNESPELMPRTSTPVSLVPSSESGISSQSELTRVEIEDPEELSALEETDVSIYIVFKNPCDDGPDIRGGTVDGLIVKATEVSKNDFMFQEAFLTTYRTLLTPMELINKLLFRYNKFILISDMRQRAARNAFALLVRVVDDMCIGDCNDKVLEILMDFIYQLVNRGDLALAKVLRTKCIEKLDQRERTRNSCKALLPSINITSKPFSLLDFKSDHLAEQMTLMDSELFLKIEIPEVLVWAKEQKEELIPNLNTFTEHFNNMSYWTRSRILDEKEAKERERLVLKFIKIMKHLRKLSNFNSYLAILSALDSAPIRRLEWQRNITESIKEYSALIDSSSSFRAYRQALADTEPPCIPYIGLILQDLTFVHIGNNDYLPDGNINFGKRWQQYNILDQMRRFKNCHYPFKRNDQIIAFFNNFEDYLSEDAMWQISEDIKPRGVTRK